MTRILVTGASGFIGSALVRKLRQTQHDVRAASRAAANGIDCAIGDMDERTDWRAALDGVSAVVHLAGPAHARFAESELRRAIVGGAEALVRQATDAGVQRFMFVSSIKACVAQTEGVPVSEAVTPQPEDAYGRAKREAEEIVMGVKSIGPVTLRPPLIFAANAKANWASLLKLLDSSAPLPLAGLGNKRSLMSLDSLLGALIAVLNAPPNVTGLYHLADQPSVSTSEIAALLRQGMGRAPRLFQAPWLMSLAPAQLRENLEIDSSLFRSTFGYAGADVRDALVACGKAWSARR